MVIDYKTDYSQLWNERIGSLPQSILYSVMPRHKMVRDNQISLDNQPPPVYALKHENTHTSPLSLYLCFAAKYQTPGVEICGKRAPNRVNACSIEVPEPHPHVWEWEQDFDFATLGVRLAPHLLLGLPMHLVVSLRSGQRMLRGGDAGKAPNFLGDDQPWDF